MSDRSASNVARPVSREEELMSVRSTVAAPTHPALVENRDKRAASVQNRIADAITTFAGSMVFVYLHVALFAG